MRNKYLDQQTASDIDHQVSKILRGLGNPDPPLNLDEVRALLELNREYYSSVDDGALREFAGRARIAGKQILMRPTLILDMVRKWDLKALYLPDRKRILIDSSQPEKKWRWFEGHETIHSVIPWHEVLMHGDTIHSLSPACHEQIEAEANYGAGRLLFLQERFDKIAKGLQISFDLVKAINRDFQNTMTSTLWRLVETTDIPALGVVSQHPRRTDDNFDPKNPCRYFIRSKQFEERFSAISELEIFALMRRHCSYQRGGPIGSAELVLSDDRGEEHLFHFEAFHIRYETLAVFTYRRPRPTAVGLCRTA
ncbi:MAG: ImmA/IrrE family metallo-endopeptidase [Terriglobia bacterium]